MNRLWIGLIIAFAALLRFWALDAGIPHRIGIDEPQIMTRVLGMLRSGDFNPRFYDYPGLYIYVQFAVACVRFITGALLGYWSSLSQPQVWEFFLWGRAVTAILGTATVVLVYQIGLRWGTRQALLAAGLMAVMPLHVRESHFILTDVPATFFVTLTFLLAIRASERPAMGTFALAGAAAGLAAATKYPAALALMLPLGMLFMTPETRGARTRITLGIVGASAAAFFAGAPYTLLDLKGFLNGYAALMASYTGSAPVEAPWETYLKHLRRNMSWPAYIAMLAGCVMAGLRTWQGGPGRGRWALVLAFPLVYFWFISRQTLVFGRYLLPMIPFACLLAAMAVVPFAGILRKLTVPRQLRTAAVVVLTALITLPPAAASVAFSRSHALKTTTGFAHDWLRAHVPPGSSVVVEGSDLSVAHMPYKSRQVAHLRQRTAKQYAEEGVDYLVASSQRYGEFLAEPDRNPDAYYQYMQLFEGTEEVARFTPEEGRPGPELRILKVKK